MNNPTRSQAEDLEQSGTKISSAPAAVARQQVKEKPQGEWAVTAFCIGLAVICAATTLIGAVPTKSYGHDVFIPLEIGWRVLHGQRPHVDFVSGWGPVWFLVAAAGLKIANYSVDGIGYANAIMALLVGTWSFLLARHRLLPLWRVVYCLFLAVLVTAPYPMGNSPIVTSDAMAYNRYGYALLGVILLECLEAARAAGGAQIEELAGGISSGVALALLLFLKVNFFLVGAAMVAALAVLLNRLAVRRLLGLASGFAGISLCLLAYLRFDIAAMLRDLRMTGAARSAALTHDAIVAKIMNRPSTALAVVLFGYVSALLIRNRVARWRGWKLPVLAAFLFLCDLSLMMTNAQWDVFPLCAFFGMLVANDLMLDQQSRPTSEALQVRPLYAGALCLAALLFVPQLTADVTSVAYGVWEKKISRASDGLLHFTSPALSSLVLFDGHVARSNGRVLTTYVNDGVSLLERESRPNETILSLDMTNPFPFALRRPPALGGIASPTYHFNIDDENRPSDDEFFGNAQIVMVPKHPALDDFYYKDFLAAYEPGIKQRYYLAGESSWWWMYRRK